MVETTNTEEDCAMEMRYDHLYKSNFKNQINANVI